MNDDELFENDLEKVTAGFNPRLLEIEKELRDGRANGTLTPDRETRLIEEYNSIQGIGPNTGRRR